MAGGAGVEGALTPLEWEVVQFFVALAQGLGLPKSLGEIYGLAYASERPICFQDLCDRLQLSKGSASQGLRALVAVGALRAAYVPGDRRDHFEPEASLRKLAGRFLADRVQPHLDNGRARLDRLEAAAAAQGGGVSPVVARRLESLRSWHGKASGLLPLLNRLFG